jgi:uncharacterized damage-inducible protein DinB
MTGFAWDNMFVQPDDDPRTDGGFVGERDTLVGYLRDQRLTLELKCSGLDAEQLARQAVEPSNLSLLGLLRHMANVEQVWFRIRLAGQQVPRYYRADNDRDGEFTGAVADPAVIEEAFTRWREEIDFADKYVAAQPDLGALGAEGDAIREVLVHMIEEYARHNGHADLLREKIDGRKGQ